MDEMRIVSKFTRGIISKAIKMVIRKKTGYNIDIQLNEAITTISDEVYVQYYLKLGLRLWNH